MSLPYNCFIFILLDVPHVEHTVAKALDGAKEPPPKPYLHALRKVHGYL